MQSDISVFLLIVHQYVISHEEISAIQPFHDAKKQNKICNYVISTNSHWSVNSVMKLHVIRKVDQTGVTPVWSMPVVWCPYRAYSGVRQADFSHAVIKWFPRISPIVKCGRQFLLLGVFWRTL